MRDRAKNKIYFDSFINEKYKSLEKRKEKFKLGLIKSDRLVPVKHNMATNYFQIVSAKYSVGLIPINLLKTDIYEGIKFLNQSLINNEGKVHVKDNEYKDQYYVHVHQELLQYFSLAYLLEISDQDFQTLVDIIDRDNISDNLYEFIIKARFPDRVQKRPEEYDTDQSVILKVYDKLRKATEQTDKIEASKLVKQFLEKDFYHKDSNCYELQNKNYNAYFGCWSFEAAAVVKIMGLDDSSFIDNQYYPKDLVHQLPEPPKKKGFLGRLGF